MIFHKEYRLVLIRGYGPLVVRLEWNGRGRTWTWGKPRA